MAWKANDATNLLYITSSYAQESEFFFKYLGDYPAETNPGWHEGVDGLAHDRNNWFITQETEIWKIPVSIDLNESSSRRAVRHLSIRNYPALAAYDHFGDPDYFELDGRGYLIVPVEGVDKAIALFNADNLEYVAQALTSQSHLSWCAIDPQGRLYSSEFDGVDRIIRYETNWDLWRRWISSSTTTTLLGVASAIRLSATFNGVQGGEITPSGELLYLVANGIQVIDLATGQRLIESSNGRGVFNFAFDPRSWPFAHEEPEGLTIWDLDDGRAPHIGGQLHVLLLDNGPGADDVYIKHYGLGPVAQRLGGGRYCSVVGSVSDASGNSIDADIAVFLRSIEIGHVTSEHGRFSMFDLPTGRYRVVASSSGHPDLLSVQYVDALFNPALLRWDLRFR